MRETAKRQALKTLRAVTYTRISRDDEKRGEGVKRQSADLDKLAASHQAEVVARLEDNDLSGSDKTDRPNFQKLIGMIERDEVDLVLATDLDRLSRGFQGYVDFYTACRDAKVAVAWKTGEANFATGEGLLNLDNRLSFAREELRVMAGRIKRVTDERRRQGLPSGGGAAYGWRTKTTIDPAESKVLLAAMDDVLKGRSLSDIAREWNAKRIRGRAGWDANIIGKMVTRPHHAGLLIHEGTVVGRGTWKPLIDRAKYERLCAAVEGRASVISHLPKRRSMLTSLLRCGICGHTMYRSSSEGHALWRCHSQASRGEGCGKVNVRAALIEPVIVEAAIQRVDDLNFAKDLRSRLAPGRNRQLSQQLEALDQREAEMGAMFAAGKVKAAAVEAFSVKADADRKAWTDELARETKRSALAEYAGKKGVLRRAWDGLTVDAQRTVIAESLGPVTIKQASHRGKRFDVTRIVFGPAPKVKTIV